MVKKRDCPYCGKKHIDGRHIRSCPERPLDEIDTPTPTVEEDPATARMKERYAKQIAHLTPENAAKFLRKAQGL